jgi:regulator of protease activity HflC (stomatin/prohibitin superfamily)
MFNFLADSTNSEDQENQSDRMSAFDCSNGKVRVIWGFCTFAAVLVSSIILGVSLKKLTSLEYGVEYDKWGKMLEDSAKQGGLFIGPPGYRFIKFPSTQITQQLQDTCLSRDGLRVVFDVTYQYQMPVDSIVTIIEKYRNFKGWDNVVMAAGVAAVQHTCADFNVTDFQGLRNVIQDAMLNNLKMKLEGSLDGITDDGVYAYASSLQLKNVELPQPYKDAVSDKQRAEEDIKLAKNQRFQEETKANTELLAAKEEARKIIDTAYNDANVTVIQANLKAEETLFALQKQQDVLEQAQISFGLNSNGIIAYITNQLFATSRKLDVTVGEPSKISRKDEL